MAASTAIYIGTGARGVLGLSDNGVTGIVIDDISFETTTEGHEYVDINNDVTSCAYVKHEGNISINGRILSGTAFTDSVADTITLTTAKFYLPTGYTTGGTTIVDNIKTDEAIGEYQKLSITAKFYPKVS